MFSKIRMILKYIDAGMSLYGFSPARALNALRGTPGYVRDLFVMKRLLRGDKDWRFGFPCPCVSDRYEPSGSARGHYFHQDLLVARRVFQRAPQHHVDVGSRIDGFVAHVASFRAVTVLDIRPLREKIPNVTFVQLDLMRPLEAQRLGMCDSLSCLHALEHFGLGRYGDPLEAQGHLRGFENLARLLAEGGMLYFSVPIGPQRIEFNGHRVFSIKYLLEMFARSGLEVVAFSHVDDGGELAENTQLTPERIENNCGTRYGCGIFELKKTAAAASGPATKA